jgi:hypothetical protein
MITPRKSRKNQLFAPRVTHQELAGRVTIADVAAFHSTESNHPTFVAGIMAASGVDPFFQGAAYGSKVSAFDVYQNFTEISALPNSTVKDMRASNHSYGQLNGWAPPREIGGYGWKIWGGNIAKASYGTRWEDYRFGLYTSESATADTVAANKAYHLMVKAAGNDRSQVGSGREIRTVWKNGVKIGNYDWCFAYLNGSLVLVDQYAGWQYVYDSQVDYYNWTTGEAFLKGGATILFLPSPDKFVFPPDGNFPFFINSNGEYVNGNPGFDSLAEGFGVAKNTLSVGSMMASSQFWYTSAAGPTDDGRLKPDVMALGSDNGGNLTGLGAVSDSDYNNSGSGTSFAAPAVSGAVTLLSQYQENLRSGKEPLRSSTFRGLLCHTADDVNWTGPDYQTGWGVVNTQRAAELIKTNNERKNIIEVYLTNGQTATAGIRAVAWQPMKVTIAWNDPAGAVQPDDLDPPGNVAPLKVLVHDLNLTLKKQVANSPVEYPYAPDPSNPDSVSGVGVNNRDNIEQVCISSPTLNVTYDLKIQQQAGTTIGAGGQWVSVIISGAEIQGFVDPAIFFAQFTYPTPTQVTATLTFNSRMGHYYKIQCVPYGGNNNWVDVSPVIYARSNMTTATSFPTAVPNANSNVAWRVIGVSPNPFNLP